MLGVTEPDFMFDMGRYFVSFVGQYGYDQMLSVLGRHVRDFINGKANHYLQLVVMKEKLFTNKKQISFILDLLLVLVLFRIRQSA